MRNGSPIILGAGRVLLASGAIKSTGKETAPYGTHALVLSSKTPWKKFASALVESLSGAGISHSHLLFDGYCTEEYTDEIAQVALSSKADVMIAMGGGRCIDTGKWAADKAGIRCVTVPTSAATCAAYVTLCVLYDSSGSTLKSVFTRNENAAVIIDPDIIVRDCPPRMYAAGIADALAKFPELDFSMVYATDWEKSALPELGLSIAQFNQDKYMKEGLPAYTSVSNEVITPIVENVLCMNIITTGLISSLASGGKQLAVAHSIYDCVCTHFKEQRKQLLHGEIVACGIQVQMGVNGYEEKRIDEMNTFLSSIGMPVKLAEMLIMPTEQNLELIYRYVIESMGVENIKIQNKIRENLSRIT